MDPSLLYFLGAAAGDAKEEEEEAALTALFLATVAEPGRLLLCFLLVAARCVGRLGRGPSRAKALSRAAILVRYFSVTLIGVFVFVVVALEGRRLLVTFLFAAF